MLGTEKKEEVGHQIEVLNAILTTLQRIEAKLDEMSSIPRKMKPAGDLSVQGHEVARNSEVEEDVILLSEALQRLGLTVDQVRPVFEKSSGLNDLAAYIGAHWNVFEKLWKEFKHALQGRGSITKKLSAYAPVDISYLCNLCTRMMDFAFLSTYHYKKAPLCSLHATVSTKPHAQAFIGGEWFERFLLTEVKAALNQHNATFGMSKKLRYLNDTVVVLPDQKGAELDLFCEVDGLYFWLEAKTSDYQQHIEKYSRMAKKTGLPAQQVMLVILDLPEVTCHSLSAVYTHLTVLNQHMVRPAIQRLLKEAFVSDQDVALDMPSVTN